MVDQENLSKYELDETKKLGFLHVAWEDYGARQTIFDNYDTIEHFKQIEDLRQILMENGEQEKEAIDELFMLLEDLNPDLFNSLGAAARGYIQARHSEDLAQVSLSLRRYMGQLADMLFPANENNQKDHALTKDKFVNRLLAYLDNNTADFKTANRNEISDLKEKIKSLAKGISKNVHKQHVSPEDIANFIVDIFIITSGLFILNFENINRPYDAYTDGIRGFILKLRQ